MFLKLIEDFLRVPFDEETGGEGEGAPAAGGSLIGGAGETGAEGEGNPVNTPEGDNAEPEGDNPDPANAAAGEGEGNEGDEPAGAPESYEEFQVPEGYQMSEEALTQFTEYAKANNWTQAQAQEAINYHSTQLQAVLTEQADAWANTRKEWIDAAKSDKEFGGQQFQENMKHVATAVQKFGTPELKQILNDTGLGDNPELVRFFYRVGKLAGEGDFHTGQGDSTGDVSPEKVLYPNMN